MRAHFQSFENVSFSTSAQSALANINFVSKDLTNTSGYIMKNSALYNRVAERYSDNEIVEGIKNGNNKVLQYLYVEYYPKVLPYLLKSQILNEDDAYDIFQESMLVCWENIKNGEMKLQNKFFSYFFGVCRNKMLMRIREKNNTATEADLDLDSFPLETNAEMLSLYPIDNTVYKSDEEIGYDILSRCFLKLNADCQSLLKWFYKGTSLSEIAKKMRYSSSYAKNKNQRCKKYLLEIIKQDKWYSLIKKDLK